MVERIIDYLEKLGESQPQYKNGVRIASVLLNDMAQHGDLPLVDPLFDPSESKRNKEEAIYRHPLFIYNAEDLSLEIEDDESFLSKTEARMLKAFVRNPNVILSRARLGLCFPESGHVDPNTIDVFIRRLRIKLDHGRQLEQSPIETIRGKGYRLNDPSHPVELFNGRK